MLECVRLRRTALRLGQDEQYLTVRQILPEVSTVRPEPFGIELKAELLTAEGGRRWRATTRAKGLFAGLGLQH